MDIFRPQAIHFRIGLLLAVLVTLYFSLTPDENVVSDTLNDKLNHFIAFAVLAFLLDYSFPSWPFAVGKTAVLIGFGTLIEVIQYFLPYRDFTLLDVLADGIGVGGYVMIRPLIRQLDWLHARRDP